MSPSEFKSLTVAEVQAFWSVLGGESSQDEDDDLARDFAEKLRGG